MNGSGKRSFDPVISSAGIVALLVIWQLSQSIADLRPVVPYPIDIAQSFWESIVGSNRTEFYSSVYSTTILAILGFIIAAAIGFVLGIGLGRYSFLRITLYPYARAIYSMPRIALLPVIVVWFGLGVKSALVLVVLTSGFTILMGVADGVQKVSQEFVEVGESFRASEWQLLSKIVLPGIVPYTIASMELGAGRAIVGVLAAELFLGEGPGLGYLLDRYAMSLALDHAFVLVIIIALLGTSFMSVFRVIGSQIEKRYGQYVSSEEIM